MSEFDPNDTPSGIPIAARPTPVDTSGRNELAAMAAGLNLDSVSAADSRLLTGLLAAAQACIAAPFASLQFLGTDQTWYLGEAAPSETVLGFGEGTTRMAVHSGGFFEIEDLERHPTFCNAPAVRKDPHLRWMATVPVRGYNGLIIGAMTLSDIHPRMSLGKTERATLENLTVAIEAALESHRARVAARAQRALLVTRLQRAHQLASPDGAAQRRTVHDLKNALTVIRLNSQAMEERGEFDSDALADIRDSLRLAEDAAKQFNIRMSTPVPVRRPTWSIVCESQRLRVGSLPHFPDRSVSIVDESPNLVGVPSPDCLLDVANMLVDRALEMSEPGAEIQLSLRVFPHFARLSVQVTASSEGLDERSSPVEPVLLHPARSALLAIGGSITSSGTNSVQRLSAWFPLDAEATYVI